MSKTIFGKDQKSRIETKELGRVTKTVVQNVSSASQLNTKQTPRNIFALGNWSCSFYPPMTTTTITINTTAATTVATTSNSSTTTREREEKQGERVTPALIACVASFKIKAHCKKSLKQRSYVCVCLLHLKLGRFLVQCPQLNSLSSFSLFTLFFYFSIGYHQSTHLNYKLGLHLWLLTSLFSIIPGPICQFS